MILKKFNDTATRKFQEGGQMMPVEAAPEAAPVQEGAPVQGGAEEQLAQLAQQLLEMLLQQIGDPNAVAAVLQMALEMLQQVAGGAEQGQPVFKKGGKMCKNVKKACGGLKVK